MNNMTDLRTPNDDYVKMKSRKIYAKIKLERNRVINLWIA